MPAPCIVTDADPVAARFCRRVTLTTMKSTDHACVTLPFCSPAVITPRWEPPNANRETLHLIDVSDAHSVASHPVCPSRSLPVYVTSPMLAPCTVSINDPVPARLIQRTRLMLARSKDHACVMLPPRIPAVIITPCVPRPPRAIRHLTDVSDAHSVTSHPVCPSRALSVYVKLTMFILWIATEIEPIPPQLTCCVLLSLH
jgi:hypothetical protein